MDTQFVTHSKAESTELNKCLDFTTGEWKESLSQKKEKKGKEINLKSKMSVFIPHPYISRCFCQHWGNRGEEKQDRSKICYN